MLLDKGWIDPRRLIRLGKKKEQLYRVPSTDLQTLTPDTHK